MDLTEEVRNGFIISSQMKKVWSIQIEMLQRLLEVCQRYQLKIWAEGGTLLGAIRHKGYIPWDDDIDMMMMREDYEKLVSIADKEFTGNLFFQCAKTDKNYIRGHAQLRRSDTAAILPRDIWQNFNQGIFIDIFVFDYLPKNEKDRIKCFKQLEKQRKYLYCRFYGSLLSSNPITHLISKFYIPPHGGYRKCFDNMEKLILEFHDKSENEIGDVLWTSNNYQKYMREKEWYASTIYVPFEHINIPIPGGYDAVLQRQYGNYMKPVQSPSYHGSIVFDVDRPYTEVLNELRKDMSLKQKLRHLFSI